MGTKQELAHRCEVELQEIERIWKSIEEIDEWQNEDWVLDDWRKGDRNIFALVIPFRDQFSLLRCLERECRKIDHLLSEIDGNKSPPGGDNDSGLDAYHLSYFRENAHRWSVRFHAYHENPFLMEKVWADTDMREVITRETASIALLEPLQEALESSTDLWKEWGTASFDVQDGIKERIKALTKLEGPTESLPSKTKDPSIAELRQEIRANAAISRKQEGIRRRKPTRIASFDSTTDEEAHQLQTVVADNLSTSLTKGESNTQSARSMLARFRSKLAGYSLTMIRTESLSEASDARTLKMPDGVFTILSIVALVSSTWLVSMSMIRGNPGWAGFSQMVLYIFQACCAYQFRGRSRSKHDGEHSRQKDDAQSSIYFLVCITAGALFATVSAFVYPSSTNVSTGFSFVANLCQVAGTISISNASGGTFGTD